MQGFVTTVTFRGLSVRYPPVPLMEDALDTLQEHFLCIIDIAINRLGYESFDGYSEVEGHIYDPTGARVFGPDMVELEFSTIEPYKRMANIVEEGALQHFSHDSSADVVHISNPSVTERESAMRETKRKAVAEKIAKKAAKEQLHKETVQTYYDIRDLIPSTAFQRLLYDKRAQYVEKYPEKEDREEGWGFRTLKSLVDDNIREIDQDVVLIQVATSYVKGAGAGIFVPARIIDQSVRDIHLYVGDKFTLDDLSALFNLYLRDQGYTPGFYVDPDRDGLRLKMLAVCVDPRREFQITDQGRAFVEEMLEFHSTVFRPARYEEMYYPVYSGITGKNSRTRRELDSTEDVSTGDYIMADSPPTLDVREYMKDPEDWVNYL